MLIMHSDTIRLILTFNFILEIQDITSLAQKRRVIWKLDGLSFGENDLSYELVFNLQMAWHVSWRIRGFRWRMETIFRLISTALDSSQCEATDGMVDGRRGTAGD